MKKLEQKVVLITGASKGIGAAIAKAMAKEGAKVVVNYNTDAQGAAQVVAEITAEGGEAIAIQANVSQKKQVEALFAKAKAAFGAITTLVNNAGVYAFEPIEMVTETQFHNHFTVNVWSTFLAIQEAIPHFGAQGGTILNIGSIASVKATPMASLYTATKSAMDGMTSVLAKELGPKQIRINAILPGPTVTEGNPMTDDIKSFVIANTPLGTLGTVTDVAQLAVFLASEDASWITGQKIGISGGFE